MFDDGDKTQKLYESSRLDNTCYGFMLMRYGGAVSTPDGVSKVCACLALCSHVHMKARRAPGICSLYKGKSTATWLYCL